MLDWKRWMIVAAALTLAACGTPTTEKGESPSKEEAAEQDGTSDDGSDLCDTFGWYGDGVCDNFCPSPDADCSGSNNGGTNNGTGGTNNGTGGTNNDTGGTNNGTGTNNGGGTNNGTGGTNNGTGGTNNDSGCASDFDCAMDERCVAGSCEPVTAGDACGGFGGLTCPDGFYCDYALADMCGAADATGTCVERPMFCPENIDPVCGCDGKTYNNACNANAAGVAVAAEGECQMACSKDADCAADEACVNGVCEPSMNTGQCGGIAGLTCSSSEWCDYPDTSMCGAADQLGQCEPRPMNCAAIYDPVCGCDGNTYSNNCIANAAGVDVLSDGACPMACQNNGTCGPNSDCIGGVCVPTGGAICGGIAGLQCRGNQYCDYPDTAMCGAGDQTGTCADKPDACAAIYDPVCGCDGMTYANSCIAASNGVDVASGGICNP